MTLETDIAAFRRGYVAGVTDSECDEQIDSYAAGHLAGRTAFMAYWIAELEAGKVEADEAFQPLPASIVMQLALRLESGRASRLAKALTRGPMPSGKFERLAGTEVRTPESKVTARLQGPGELEAAAILV
jgi:hypothetical protein